MKTKSQFKNLLKISLLTGFIPLVFNNQPVRAVTECPADDSVTSLSGVSSPCFITPEKYEVTFFELGFCTVDPLATATLDKSNCSKSWDNTTGVTTDLALKTFNKMPGNTYKIPNGVYTHAYVVMSNSSVLKGKYKLKNGPTFYSKANYSGSTNASEYDSFIDKVVDMEGNEGTNLCYDYAANTTYGPVKAVLTDTNLVSATNTSTCNSASRMVGSITMNSSLIMDDSVKGYRLTWIVTNMGMGLHIDGSGNPTNTLGGPFAPNFTLIK